MGIKTVNSVLGPVDTDKLGRVLMHEHVCAFPGGWYGDATRASKTWREEVVKDCEKVLKELKCDYGLGTIVEATPSDYSRDISILQEISDKTGVNIVCCTGWMCAPSGSMSYWNLLRAFDYDISAELEDLYSRELYEGIADTGAKPGVIKIATHTEFTDFDRAVFAAVGNIARSDRNVRIITHTADSALAIEQCDALLAEGVLPSQVTIGHIDAARDIETQIAVAEKGFFLGFDRFSHDGSFGLPTDEHRIARLAELVERGYGDRIVLSHDCVRRHSPLELELPEWLQQCWRNQHYDHIFKRMIPKMEEAGLTETQIDDLLIFNPRRFFEGGGR